MEQDEPSDPLTDHGRLVPRSRRGQLTRAGLLRAAREVFERDGFLDAKISDIAETAGVAVGSFYTYFADKEAAFAALVEQTQDEMLHPGVHNVVPQDDVVAMIETSNRVYLNAYRRNAKLMKLFEQVATIDDGFRELRRQRTVAFTERNAHSIRRWQKEGRVDRDLDPVTASMALSAMVSRLAYMIFALEFEDPDFESLVATVTRLWVNALGLDPGAGTSLEAAD